MLVETQLTRSMRQLRATIQLKIQKSFQKRLLRKHKGLLAFGRIEEHSAKDNAMKMAIKPAIAHAIKDAGPKNPAPNEAAI